VPADDFFASQLARLQTRLNSATHIVKSGSLYSTQKLEELLISIAGTDELVIDSAMESDNKLFLVSTLATTFPPQIYLWRNYQYPVDGMKSRYLGTMTNKLWEALRASSCAPTYFDEFTIGGDKHQVISLKHWR
jgi:calcium-independent phospholipase A2-gamma